MKRFFLFATIVCAALFSSCEGYDDSDLVNRLNDFENRLKKLEELCSQMNTDITSLRTIVTAIQKNDQISTIAPISKDGKEIGYSIVFTSGKSITIYHGNDGQNGENGSDGENGQDGADGYTPVIGVKQDTDGVYYWTVDGEWLIDENGNKVQASPSEADSGADGKDGVTPKLKIENEYWYVSYDEGQTWTKLGKATGAQGEQGPQGPQGSNGDSIFQSVTQDSNNVYFKLADGTTITIPKSSGAQSIALTYIPRYSDGKATVFYTSKSDSYVELDFEVSPASAAANWRNYATVKAVYTQTRAGVQMVDMSILSWSVDSSNGTITVKASGANLSDAFFAGSQEASVRLAIEDDNINLVSDYIPMVAKKTNAQPDPEPEPEPEPTTQPNNEIWYTSSDGNIVTPDDFDVFGANIVSNTYANGKGIIKFDGNVTSIGDSAFYRCQNLKEITMPNSVISIGQNAFYGCSSLTNVSIGNSVTSIGDSAFEDCSRLTNVSIGNSVTSIGNWAFYKCSRLTSITIPNSVTSIGKTAFSSCSSLTSITIPNSVTSIGEFAFDNCSSLTEVTIGNGVISIGEYAFAYCSSLTDVSIGNSVTSIGSLAFYRCSNLTSITLPNSVTSIGQFAFSHCSSLQNIFCKPTTPPTASSNMFDMASSLAKIYVPTGSGAAYKAAQYWSNYASMIEEKDM